jgi:hypothetical protein
VGHDKCFATSISITYAKYLFPTKHLDLIWDIEYDIQFSIH